MDVLAAACGAAALVGWFRTSGRRVPRPAHAVTWLALLLLAWVGISGIAALVQGTWSAAGAYRLRQFAIVMTLCFVAAHAFGHRAHVWVTGLVLAGIVVAAGASGAVPLDLNQNVAAFALLVLPLLGAAVAAGGAWLAAAAAPLALVAAALVLQTRNRGAAVGLAVLLLVMAAQSRRRGLLLGLSVLVMLAGGAALAGAGYGERFADIWRRGPSFGTVQERLDLWAAGLRMTADRPVVGVGLGNYPAHVGAYAPALRGMDPHNHVIAMATETGVAGVVLYVAFFTAALTTLWRLGQRHYDTWQGATARWFAGGLAAWFAVGFFLGLHTNAIAFGLAGAAAALGPRAAGRRAPPG
jgi:O-antigen ligase